MNPVTSLVNLSTSALELVLQHDAQHLSLNRYGGAGQSWLNDGAEGELFAATIDGQRYTNRTLAFDGIETDYSTAGVQHVIARFSEARFVVEHHLKVYQDTALTECWQVIRCTGDSAIEVTRLDSFTLDIPAGTYSLFHYTTDWGSEFEPVHRRLAGDMTLETRYGRSSKGQHPWFALTEQGGAVLSGSVAWSGNWVFRFEPLENGAYRLSGGLHDWEFSKSLAPNDAIETPIVVLVLGQDLNAVSRQYARVGRQYWYPRTTLSATAPVEWNHWWSYEDDHISEAVFRENVTVAQSMGVEICMLDAGWFGPSDAGSFWYDYRGDWDQINTERFPRGLRPLSDYTHAHGMKFGLWCEIEALGVKARLAETHPELVAQRDGERLGYICFGNPETQEFAYQTLARLIRETNLDWIKLDFNLDPGAGCNRSDHGHGVGDGLYAHYMGYYQTLNRIRQDFPEVTLESCSSGGLRIDLGLLRYTDMTFLSDPDYPVHDLQLFWGASTMLAPDSILHWSFSDWINKNPPPQQNFNPRDPNLRPHQFDYYTRISMLNVFGFSQKLPELPAWVESRLSHHTRIYKQYVRRFVREADVYRLTEQPRRDGSGDRWSAFQYRLPDQSENLLFVFRLPGGEASRLIRLDDLQPDRLYRLVGFEGEDMGARYGKDLMQNGVLFDTLPEEGSALLRVL
ncbi:MAG: alpha-galactosidase [Anaerolineaceae bacterium]|nr:alpha-galactosidase [Anaerolineaceae bacterium]